MQQLPGDTGVCQGTQEGANGIFLTAAQGLTYKSVDITQPWEHSSRSVSHEMEAKPSAAYWTVSQLMLVLITKLRHCTIIS